VLRDTPVPTGLETVEAPFADLIPSLNLKDHITLVILVIQISAVSSFILSSNNSAHLNNRQI
jgi:hypothetical protein